MCPSFLSSPSRFLSGWIVLVCALSTPACGPHATERRTAPGSPLLRRDTALDVGDVFDVRVFGENDLSNKYRVGGDGTIDFPLVGSIKVAGLLPSQLAALIAGRLRDGILREPQVSVFVNEQVSKKIYVMGQVARPGTFSYTSGMTIIEAITQAGGFTPLSNRNGTTVTRMEDGKQTTINVAVGAISKGSVQNFPVRPGDIISVPESLF